MGRRLKVVSAALTTVAVTATAVGIAALPAAAVQIKPDRNFAGDGRTALAMPGYQYATDVVIDGTTSYVIGNTPKRNSRDVYRIVVTKYGPGGRLDRSFGDHGKKYLLLGKQSRAFSGALTPDGGILVAGWAQLRRPSAIMAKLRPNGSLDRDFAGNGVAKVALDQGLEWPLVDAEPDGDIWLAWASVKRFDYKEHNSDLRVMHFGPGGRVDRSFSGDGVRTFDVRNRDYTYFSTMDANGRFYLTGMSKRSQRSVGSASLISVSDHGPSHTRTINPWGRRGSFPLTVDADGAGKVVLGLSPYRGAGWGATRVSPDLSIDKSYGKDGYARHDCSCISYSGALTDQGLILVGGNGERQQQTAVARFTTAGRWDKQLGNANYNLFRDWEFWVETEVDSSQRLIVAGTVKNEGADIAISRMRFV